VVSAVIDGDNYARDADIETAADHAEKYGADGRVNCCLGLSSNVYRRIQNQRNARSRCLENIIIATSVRETAAQAWTAARCLIEKHNTK
jgi:hypothetical protein